MTLGVIIQVHKGSTRCPGKVYAPMGDKFLIDLVVEQVKKAGISPIILATNHTLEDHDLCEDAAIRNEVLHSHWCWDWNVLGRMIATAEEHGLTDIVRVCSDDPFLNPLDIQRLVSFYENSSCDLVKFKGRYGIQVVSLSALQRAVKDLPYHPIYDREHATSWIYNHPDKFEVKNLNHSIDEPEDLEEARRFYAAHLSCC